jgi:hypothetical protein
MKVSEMEDEAYNVSETFLDQKDMFSVVPLRSIAISLKRIADAVSLPEGGLNLAEFVQAIAEGQRNV